MTRDYNFRKHHKNRVVNNKLRILKDNWKVPEDILDDRFVGMLDKGKIHCSCWMCSPRSNREGFKYKEEERLRLMAKEKKKYLYK